MYSHRRAAYRWIESNLPENNDRSKRGFSRNTMDKYAPEVSNSIGIVSHFIADVATLASDDMIDKKLAKRLFWDTAMKDWFEHFEAAYISGNFDNSDDYVIWYKRHVRPFKIIMESID